MVCVTQESLDLPFIFLTEQDCSFQDILKSSEESAYQNSKDNVLPTSPGADTTGYRPHW